jgi:hypothetical protein
MNKSFTRGKIISEADLYTYMKCSELYHLGHDHKLPNDLLVLKQAFRKMIINKFKNGRRKANTNNLVHSIEKAIRDLEIQKYEMEDTVDKIRRSTILAMDQIFGFLPLAEYDIVSGPMPIRIHTRDSCIELEIDAILKKKHKDALQIVGFVHGVHHHTFAWDIPTHLKIQYAKQFVNTTRKTKEYKVKAHIFGYSTSLDLLHTTITDRDLNQNLNARIKDLLNNMDRGYHMPLLPCLYSCKYKNVRCRP